MFNWLKSRQRKKILDQPFPRPWQEILHGRLWQYGALSLTDRDRLHASVKVMVSEKHWEGCNGITVTDDMRVTIAGHAATMLLGTNDYYFDGVRTVLIYPQAFDRQTNNGGIQDTELRGGEAWQNGPIVLSWDNVMMIGKFPDQAHNIVIHEFAHHLDGLDGEMGGTPIFDNPDDHRRWLEVLEREFAGLQSAARQRQWTVLSHYGAKSKAEFFAVSSECFFENPLDLQRSHAELYDLLQRYYRVNPIEWVA